jgi:hypothetical protein
MMHSVDKFNSTRNSVPDRLMNNSRDLNILKINDILILHLRKDRI